MDAPSPESPVPAARWFFGALARIEEHPQRAYAIAIGLTVVIFLGDVLTPVSMAIWAFYIVPFFLLTFAARRFVGGAVVVYAVLILISILFTPAGTISIAEIAIDRVMFIVSLCVVAALLATVQRQRADLIVENERRRRAENEVLARNEDLQHFAYVASHDLQEPLRSIISFSQLLERRYRGELDADADDYIGFIVEGGTRMQCLIRDLLAYSRVGTATQTPAPTDAGEVVADVVRSLDLLIREASGRVSTGPLPTVVADRMQLQQVFSNLIGNAIKYRRPGVPPEVRVSARREGAFWEFSVADNGIGIAAEHRDRIFEMFRRLHTHDEYDGTGIGLAVVKKIVERHGGTVRVESTPGDGSTFFFTMPAA